MVKVRLFAAAAEAAGVEETQVSAGTVGELRATLIAAHGDDLERVLQQCAVVFAGHRVSDEAVIDPGATVDVLPPFAGG